MERNVLNSTLANQSTAKQRQLFSFLLTQESARSRICLVYIVNMKYTTFTRDQQHMLDGSKVTTRDGGCNSEFDYIQQSFT